MQLLLAVADAAVAVNSFRASDWTTVMGAFVNLLNDIIAVFVVVDSLHSS